MSTTDKPNRTCEWVSEHVDEYVDRLLDPDDAARLRSHCDSCVDCQYELELAIAVKEGLADLQMLACPDEVTDGVFHKISSANAAELHRTPVWLTIVKPLWRPVSIAAAVAAVVVMTTLVTLDRDSSPNQAEVNRAVEEAKFALAVISNVGRQTGKQVGADVNESVVQPVRDILADRDNGL